MKQCKGPQCNRKPVTKEMCVAHYRQVERGRPLTVIGPRGRKKTKKQYAEQNTCTVCWQTKHWTAFVMGMEVPTGECRECYRTRILAPPKDEQKEREAATNWAVLMDLIEMNTSD